MLNKNMINNYINKYYKSLNDKTIYYELDNNIYRITTPFLDNNNAFIEIYIKDLDDNNILLSDASVTLDELALNDITLTDSRERLISSTLEKYNVKICEDEELCITSHPDNFASDLNLLIQCLLSMYNMITYTCKNNIISLFNDDVKIFFENNKIQYNQDIKLKGKSNLISSYDFLIKKDNDRYIKTFSRIDTPQIKNLIFSWNDTDIGRNKNSDLIAVIDDRNSYDVKKLKNYINALDEYKINSILWSEKEKIIA